MTVLRDIRFAVRNLLNRRSFTVIVILVLALGIGATTAIFSIVDAILLRPLPYVTADRLVRVRQVSAKGLEMSVSGPNFRDLLAQSRSFEQLSFAAGSFPLAVTGGAEPGLARVSYASASFFKAVGVAPIAGRLFVPEEEKWGGPVAVIVSYSYWQRMLGGRADFNNVRLNVDGVSCNVVGVLPDSFDYRQTEVWITGNTEPPNTSRTAHGTAAIGLLRQGTSLAEAQAEVTLIAKQLRQTYGEKTDAVDFTLIPLQTFLTRSVRQGLWLLLGSVGLLLLVACANFSNLLLSQILTRQREFTLRVALGASRARLTRQVLVENLALTIPGATFGVLLARFGVRLVLILDNGTFPRFNSIGVDIRVLSFACALGILIAIILSFLPGIRSRHDLTTGLKAGSRGQTPGGRGARLRGALVVGQVGLTLVLLTGAGLLARSFLNVMEVKPGFDTGGAISMTLSLPTTISVEEDEQIRQFYAQLLERVSQLPGVTAVGGINVLPLTPGTGSMNQFLIDNDESQRGQAVYRLASAGYFSAMRIPLLRGRVFDKSDTVTSQHVCVISQSLAQRYWPNGGAIGRRIHFGIPDQDKTPMEVVGIVADVLDATLERQPQPTAYGFSLQKPQWFQVVALSIVVRSQSDPQALIPSLRDTVQSLRPDVPTNFSTLEKVYSSAFDTRRFTLTLFGVFGGVALLITIIGLYGTLTFSVTERTREMGIRMALGAQRSSVLRLVITQGFKLAALGVIVGLFGAWALTRLMANLLFGVTATDPLTISAVVAALAIVALIACYAPARRATKVDPLVALRDE